MAASVTPGAKPASVWSGPMSQKIIPGDLPKGQGGKGKVNRRPSPAIDTHGYSTATSSKEILIDAKTRDAFLAAHQQIAATELKLLVKLQRICTEFSTASKKERAAQETSYLTKIATISNELAGLRTLIGVGHNTAKKMHADGERDARISKILEAQDYGTSDPLKQDEIDAAIGAIAQRPVPAELKSKIQSFDVLIGRIEEFKKKIASQNSTLELSVPKITAIVSLPSTSEKETVEKENKIRTDVVPLVESLKLTKAELLIEAKEINRIIPQSFLRLVELIKLYESIHGATKKDSQDPSFVCVASLCSLPLASPVDASLSMYNDIQLLKNQVKSMETIWADVIAHWRITTDETRRCSMMLKEKRVCSLADYISNWGRPHVGVNAHDVESFAFDALVYERPKETSSWFSWPFSSSQSSSSTPVTSSSEPIKPPSGS